MGQALTAAGLLGQAAAAQGAAVAAALAIARLGGGHFRVERQAVARNLDGRRGHHRRQSEKTNQKLNRSHRRHLPAHN
jgi:hypothetical protein